MLLLRASCRRGRLPLRSRMFVTVLAALAAVVATACGKDSSSGPTIGPPSSVSVAAGSGQSALVGSALTQDLSVKVTDASGRAASGSTVVWAVLSGGGSVSPATSTTDANGVATTKWTLGNTAGQQSVSASVLGVTTVATFTATATPGPVTQVTAQFAGNASAFSVGDSIQIQPSAVDQFGNAVGGQSFTYSSSNPAVATVSSTGVVRGVATGTATITITSGTRSTTLQITVSSSACNTSNTLTLQVGETRTYAGALGGLICLGGGASGSEYTMIPYYNEPSGSATVTLAVTALNTVAVTGPPTPAVLPSSPSFGAQIGAMALTARRPDLAFERQLRERERRELTPLIPAAQAWWRARQAAGGARFSVSQAVPNVGDILTLNAQANSGCSNALNRPARVMAISRGAIVVADTGNPAGGFTDADFQQFAADFDNIVNPVDTTNFGSPTDIDQNGHVIIFFTREVNRLTPPNSPSFVGGFFFLRDLYPKTGTANLPACPTSNQAEMFYVLAPDPNGTINGNKFSTADVKSFTTGTIAHEYQHLINASRRLYILNTTNFEVVWLDEGLSHVAEELTFYKASGLTPRQNITIDRIRSSQTIRDATNSYQSANLGRYSEYLLNPEGNSPIAPNDSLGTRGATWSFLRYSADRLAGDETAFWRALHNTTLVGVQNLQNALKVDPMQWIQDWTVANYTDDAVPNVPPQYTHPSWNFRSVLPVINNNQFPLKVTVLVQGAPATVKVTGGSAAYLRVGVAANGSGRVSTTANAPRLEAPPPTVSITVVRTK